MPLRKVHVRLERIVIADGIFIDNLEFTNRGGICCNVKVYYTFGSEFVYEFLITYIESIGEGFVI